MTLAVPLLLTSRLVRCEDVLHSCGTNSVDGVPTCDNAHVHSWKLYSAVSLEHQATGTITCYPTQLHYPDTEQMSPCHILIMLSA